MASVTLTNLQKTFVDTQTKPAREVKAVNDLDLKIHDGEFLVLVGPSGCGKTTTMRMVAGLEEATGGEIRIGERVVNDVPPRDRNIAMVFQNYALYPHMSVYENMAFGLKLRMMPPFFERLTNAAKTREVKAEIDRRIKEAAEILGITHLLDRKPKALSGGQRQRVALGRAIVREPQVFLMDEPLSNLDAKLRVQTRAELIQLHRRLGITTIYVTHDQAEAMTMGQRIAVMKDGLLQQCDTPLTLYHKPVNMFVAGFLGTPSMNFIKNARLRLENGVPIVDAGEFSVTLPAAHAERLAAYNGKNIIIGIRPENIADKSLLSGAAAETNVVRMQVEVIEPMGARSTLLLSLGAQTLVAEVDPETRAKEGAPLDVVLDTSRVHLFDPTTEDAIL